MIPYILLTTTTTREAHGNERGLYRGALQQRRQVRFYTFRAVVVIVAVESLTLAPTSTFIKKLGRLISVWRLQHMPRRCLTELKRWRVKNWKKKKSFEIAKACQLSSSFEMVLLINFVVLWIINLLLEHFQLWIGVAPGRTVSNNHFDLPPDKDFPYRL